jgi:poly-beta-1,6-N-acetyl-D-glucosamine synthase
MAWCYIGYPVFIAMRAALHPRPAANGSGSPTARVAVVLAVRNEARAIEARIVNLLEQEYPADRLNVYVACNGCQDDTVAVVERLTRENPRVRLVVSPGNEGKSGALNRGVAAASEAEIIVFADARQTFAPDAIKCLVSSFAQADVGAASGRLIVGGTAAGAVKGVRAYVGFERWLRGAESRSGSVVGATGAIYAIRRALFETMPPNIILDDVYTPLRIAMRGGRVVMAADALAYDVPAKNTRMEFTRKRRTMVGNIQLIAALPGILSPRNPLLLRYLSHKILRLLTPVCCLGMLLVSALLPGIYRAFFAAELSVYLLGLAGLLFPLPFLSFPSAFVLMNGAIIAAALRWRDDAAKVWLNATAGSNPPPAAQ